VRDRDNLQPYQLKKMRFDCIFFSKQKFFSLKYKNYKLDIKITKLY
jgi:hypothetical protein